MKCLLLVLLALPCFAFQENDPQQDQYFTLAGDYAASHILVSHVGAERVRPDVTRSEEEALSRARAVIAELDKKPSRFEDLARLYSDGPTGLTGGDLGGFDKGKMDPKFEKALKALEIGTYTAEPVKTQFGYHIIRRNPLRTKRYATRALLVTFRGALPVGGLKQNIDLVEEDQALEIAQDLRARINDENFVALAAENSHLELPTAFLGVFRRGQSAVFNQIIDTLETLDYGEISQPARLTVGYVILQRLEVKQLAGAQILITHIDSPKSPPNVLRIRKEARELAQKLCDQLKKNPSKFEKLAKKHSDDVSRYNGGLIPKWYVGYRDAAVEAAMQALEPGQISSEPVETSDGFFILRRDPAQ